MTVANDVARVPWEIRFGGGPEGFTVAEKGSGRVVCEYWPAGPDDRLPAIAAALVALPDLLDAARYAVECDSEQWHHAHAKLVAAIAKAERGAS